MPARFPRIQADGSFCVKVTMLLDVNASPNLASRFADWSESWVLDNEHWSYMDEQLRYSAEFFGAPRSVTVHDGKLSFRLDGRSGAKRWKNWNLRLMHDAESAFVEILKFESIVDCPE